jgi:hypothetical protein
MTAGARYRFTAEVVPVENDCIEPGCFIHVIDLSAARPRVIVMTRYGGEARFWSSSDCRDAQRSDLYPRLTEPGTTAVCIFVYGFEPSDKPRNRLGIVQILVRRTISS